MLTDLISAIKDKERYPKPTSIQELVLDALPVENGDTDAHLQHSMSEGANDPQDEVFEAIMMFVGRLAGSGMIWRKVGRTVAKREVLVEWALYGWIVQ